MIEELAKNDDLWRKYALKICGCKMLADDLVQELYLKFMRTEPDRIDKDYVFISILNLYRSHLRKEVKHVNISDIEEKFSADYETKNDELALLVREKLSNHDDYFAELALINADGKSLREIGRIYKQHYLKVYYEIKAIKDDLREDKEINSIYAKKEKKNA